MIFFSNSRNNTIFSKISEILHRSIRRIQQALIALAERERFVGWWATLGVGCGRKGHTRSADVALGEHDNI
jgi:hypothetical protein